MELLNYKLLPGVVCAVNDTEHLGRVKASIPGFMTTDNTKVSSMYWIYPIGMWGYQGFSKIVEGSKIWILQNKTNPTELWYWPMFELNPNTKNLVGSYDDVDVVVSRSNGGSNSAIYYKASEGIVSKVGNSKINIKPDGSVDIMDENGGKITIQNGHIRLNTEETDDYVMGFNSMKELLSKLSQDITNVASIAQSHPYTSHLYEPIKTTADDIDDAIDGLKIDDVHV